MPKSSGYLRHQLGVKWNALPASRVLSSYLALLRGDANAKAKAMRTGMIAESVIHSVHSALRDQVDETIGGIGGLLANTVLPASGLTKHTDSLRQAFGMEYLGMLADEAGKVFAQLPVNQRRVFARYGIDASMWDVIRRGVEDFDGMRFVSPAKLDQMDRRVGSRLMELIETEMDHAVLQPGARERSLMVGSTRRGTFVGEALRTTMQYKSFAVTMLTTHLMRGLAENGAAGKLGYLVPHMIGLTTLGALSYQMRELVKGRDPMDMTQPRFWLRAVAQGGGLGIMGDFLYGAVDRHGMSFYAQMFGGPGAGLLIDTVNLTGANISAISKDQDANFGRDLARFVERYTPGSSLWYARLALDRLLWENLQRAVDPRARDSFRRTEQRARKESGAGVLVAARADAARPSAGCLQLLTLAQGKYLHRYLGEFDFRYSERTISDPEGAALVGVSSASG